jgi:hypothetical protein
MYPDLTSHGDAVLLTYDSPATSTLTAQCKAFCKRSLQVRHPKHQNVSLIAPHLLLLLGASKAASKS